MPPVDVIAVRVWRGRGRGVWRIKRGEDFAQDDEDTATVEQGVVKGPDEAEVGVAKLEEREPHERRFVHGEAAAAILVQPRGEPCFAVVIFTPVLAQPRHVCIFQNLLHRLRVPPKRGAQNRMTRDHFFPGRAQGGGADFFAQRADHLLDVHAAARRGERVEKHAVLERRERVGGDDFSPAVGAVGRTEIHAVSLASPPNPSRYSARAARQGRRRV